MFRSKMSRLRNASREYDGLYFPKVIPPRTVSTEDLLKEISRNCSLKRSDLIAVLTELSEFLLHHLPKVYVCRAREDALQGTAYYGERY